MPVIRLPDLADRLRRDERGVTMYLAIALMFITSVLMAAVLTATSTDATLSRRDLDTKKATYAAQAGIAAYLQQLNTNPNYWTTCPTSPAGSAYTSGQTTPVPDGTTNDESFSYTPLPAPGYTACQTSNPTGSMVTAAGTFRVQFNGFSGVADGSANPVGHSIVVTFKHDSFLSFAYFTHREQLNPTLDNSGAGTTDCTSGGQGLTVKQILAADLEPPDGPCQLINWVTGDTVNGPMYSDDYFYVCGQPRWGSQPSDTIDTQGVEDNNSSGCAPDTPYVNQPGGTTPGEGTLQSTYTSEPIPQSNDTLEALAEQQVGGVQQGAIYDGFTQIALNGSTYTVTNANVNSGTPTVESMPPDGIIYVAQSSASCSTPYNPYTEDYTEYNSGGSDYGCGTVEVQGNYSSSLTIASAQDVIVTGSLTTNTSGTAVLGLVPQDWARVFHEVMYNGSVSNCQAHSDASDNTTLDLNNPTIDAAILTVTDSFIVDNYNCGGAEGNLNVDGAIAQNYRGTVGTTGGGGTGYIKNYSYDTRLEDESPPYFLSPVNPAWTVESESQCSSIEHLPSAAPSTGSNELVPSANLNRLCY